MSSTEQFSAEKLPIKYNNFHWIVIYKTHRYPLLEMKKFCFFVFKIKFFLYVGELSLCLKLVERPDVTWDVFVYRQIREEEGRQQLAHPVPNRILKFVSVAGRCRKMFVFSHNIVRMKKMALFWNLRTFHKNSFFFVLSCGMFTLWRYL